MKHWFVRAHTAVYRRDRGRPLGSMGGQPNLLLETAGRRTGRRRTTPVQYLAVDGASLVVASNAGADRPPAWYLNLRTSPHARIQRGDQSTGRSGAGAVAGEEREALWRRLIQADKYLEGVARKAGRELPLILLSPVRPTTTQRADDLP